MAAVLLPTNISNTLKTARENPDFVVGSYGEKLYLERCIRITPFQKYINACTLVDTALAALKKCDIRSLSADEYTRIDSEVALCERYATQVLKGKAKLSGEQKEYLQAKVLSLKLGGRLKPKHLKNTEFARFIQQNHLHHAFPNIRLQIHETADKSSPLIPYTNDEGIQKEIPWNMLLKRVKDSGDIEFLDERGYVVFVVDASFTLSREYSFHFKGFTRYDRFTTPHILPLDERLKDDGKPEYCIDIVVSTSPTQKSVDDVGGCSGQHAYIEAFDPKYRYSMGKYARFDELTVSQQACVTATKKGAIHSPDEYSFMPKRRSLTTRTTVKVSKEQFEKFMRRIEHDKREDAPAFSVLQKNCTAYICTVMKEEIGLELEAEIPIGHYVFYYLPTTIKSPFKWFYSTIYQNLPTPVRFAISLVSKPVYRLYSFSIGIVAKLLSMNNHVDYRDIEISWTQVVTNLFWDSISVFHPTQLRHHLRTRFRRGFVDTTRG